METGDTWGFPLFISFYFGGGGGGDNLCESWHRHRMESKEWSENEMFFFSLLSLILLYWLPSSSPPILCLGRVTGDMRKGAQRDPGLETGRLPGNGALSPPDMKWSRSCLNGGNGKTLLLKVSRQKPLLSLRSLIRKEAAERRINQRKPPFRRQPQRSQWTKKRRESRIGRKNTSNTPKGKVEKGLFISSHTPHNQGYVVGTFKSSASTFLFSSQASRIKLWVVRNTLFSLPATVCSQVCHVADQSELDLTRRRRRAERGCAGVEFESQLCLVKIRFSLPKSRPILKFTF